MYGNRIRSAFVKEVGTGQFKAEWTANLPEAGKYEIFIYRPHYTTSRRDIYTTDFPGMKNYYTVYTPQGKEEIILEVQEGNFDLSNLYLLPEEEAWVSLGKFNLPAGESRVVLDDRGVDHPFTSEKYRYSFIQLVIADAVKWVKEK